MKLLKEIKFYGYRKTLLNCLERLLKRTITSTIDAGLIRKTQQRAENSRAKILMVDDEVASRELVSIILTDAGYQVALASDGIEALALFNGTQFDLVITDIRMPGMDGLQLLEAIMKTRSDAAVIMLTAYGDEKTYSKAMSLGAKEYINKPIRIKELLRIVHIVLTRKEA